MRSAQHVAGLALIAAVVLAGGACGGAAAGSTSAEAQAAKDSQYSCKRKAVFDAAVKAVAENFQVVKSQDLARGVVIGEPRWFDKNGSPRPVGVDLADLEEGDIALAARVRIIDLRPNYKLDIDSVVKQRLAGSPLPRDLAEGDPQRPGWIQVKLDRLRLGAHRRLEACASLMRRPH